MTLQPKETVDSSTTNINNKKSSFKEVDKTALQFVGYQSKNLNNKFCNDEYEYADKNLSTDADYANDDDDDYNQDNLDELECNLLNENFSAGGSTSATSGNSRLVSTSQNVDVNKKMNFSSRVENDITRSEKKSEKRVNYYGRDDRATSEQVMDPRTRLILFKLLNNGFLSEIDGKIYFTTRI